MFIFLPWADKKVNSSFEPFTHPRLFKVIDKLLQKK